MWKSSQHLAGYEQQDAHECFISVLTALQVFSLPFLAAKRYNAANMDKTFLEFFCLTELYFIS